MTLLLLSLLLTLHKFPLFQQFLPQVVGQLPLMAEALLLQGVFAGVPHKILQSQILKQRMDRVQVLLLAQ